jgi:sugar phosphate isomerase/epimerase
MSDEELIAELDGMFSVQAAHAAARLRELIAEVDEWQQCAGVEADERRRARAEVARLKGLLREAHRFGFWSLAGPANEIEQAETERAEQRSWDEFAEMAAALATETTPVPLGPELVSNPDFSTNVDGWATVIDARGPDAKIIEQGEDL